MRQDGLTLIELMVVIMIVGVLAGLGVVNFRNWIVRYSVEKEIKELNASLSEARLRAMTTNRVHFVGLASGSYTVYDDTDPAPNGDEALNTGSDTQVYPPKTLEYPITWGLALGVSVIEFGCRGLCNTNGTICIYSTAKPEYDCLRVSTTRIRLGKLSSQGACDADVCQIK